MKNLILCLLCSFVAAANAQIPLPQAVPNVPQEGWIMHGMHEQEELKRQQLENQILEQQLEVMRQENPKAARKIDQQNQGLLGLLFSNKNRHK